MLIGIFGKGGVGKTTISLGLGLLLGRAKIITTDPYPGLRELLPDPPPGLELIEISYDELREDWKKEFGEEALNIFRSLTDVGEDFLDYLSTAPGLVEQYAVYRVVKEEMGSPGQIVIWDTQGAPGVMSLIRSELEFYSHLKKAPIYWSKLKKLFTKDVDIERIIEHWKNVAHITLERLSKTRTVVVINPDMLSVKIGKALAEELRNYTAFSGFILNKYRGDSRGHPDLSPLLSTIPEVNDVSPFKISAYLSGLKDLIAL